MTDYGATEQEEEDHAKMVREAVEGQAEEVKENKEEEVTLLLYRHLLQRISTNASSLSVK